MSTASDELRALVREELTPVRESVIKIEAELKQLAAGALSVDPRLRTLEIKAATWEGAGAVAGKGGSWLAGVLGSVIGGLIVGLVVMFFKR